MQLVFDEDDDDGVQESEVIAAADPQTSGGTGEHWGGVTAAAVGDAPWGLGESPPSDRYTH